MLSIMSDWFLECFKSVLERLFLLRCSGQVLAASWVAGVILRVYTNGRPAVAPVPRRLRDDRGVRLIARGRPPAQAGLRARGREAEAVARAPDLHVGRRHALA